MVRNRYTRIFVFILLGCGIAIASDSRSEEIVSVPDFKDQVSKRDVWHCIQLGGAPALYESSSAACPQNYTTKSVKTTLYTFGNHTVGQTNISPHFSSLGWDFVKKLRSLMLDKNIVDESEQGWDRPGMPPRPMYHNDPKTRVLELNGISEVYTKSKVDSLTGILESRISTLEQLDPSLKNQLLSHFKKFKIEVRNELIAEITRNIEVLRPDGGNTTINIVIQQAE